jgi:hypothetical protein
MFCFAGTGTLLEVIAMASECLPIARVCCEVGVPAGSFYGALRQTGAPGDAVLLDEGRQTRSQTHDSYGSGCIRGVARVRACGVRLPRILACVCVVAVEVRDRRRTAYRRVKQAVAVPHRLDRHFQPAKRDWAWAGDITCVATSRVLMRLPIVMDQYAPQGDGPGMGGACGRVAWSSRL